MVIILMIIIITGFICFEETGGWFYITFIVFVPALLILLIADFIVKVLMNRNVKSIWRIEIFVVVIVILCYVYSLYF